MRYCRLVGLALCLLQGDATGAERTLWVRQQEGAWSSALVTDDEFDTKTLKSAANNVLRERKEPIVQLYIVGKGSGFIYGKPSHLTGETWFKLQREIRSGGPRVAVLTAVNGNAVLRIRKGDSVTRTVVSGSDPLFYDVGGAHFEILHVHVASPPFGFSIFAQAKRRISLQDAEKLYEALKADFGPKLHLQIRSDPWFATSMDFPLYYWFDLSALPSLREMEKAPEIMCPNYSLGTSGCSAERLAKDVL